MSYVRRPLYTEERVRALFASTLEDLRAQHRQHLRDMADLRRELDQVRAQYDELCAAVLAREKAESNLELLRRDREKQTRIAEGERYWLH